MSEELFLLVNYLSTCHIYRIIEETQSSPAIVEEIAISFFSLLENILRTENLSTTSMVGNSPFLAELLFMAAD